MVLASFPDRHGLHKERESFLEVLGPWSAAFVVPEAYDDEIVGRNDQRRLAAGTRHVVGVLWDREPAVPIDPEEAPVDGALIGFPCRRQSADELYIALGQNSVTIPHTILKIEVAESSPIAPRCKFVPLGEKVSKRVGFDHHRPNADPVEERALRERQILLPPLFDGEANEVVDQNRI